MDWIVWAGKLKVKKEKKRKVNIPIQKELIIKLKKKTIAPPSDLQPHVKHCLDFIF